MTIVCIDILNEKNNGEDNDMKDWKISAVDMFFADFVKGVKGENFF